MADGRRFPSTAEYAAWSVLTAETVGAKAVYVTTDSYDALPDFSARVIAHNLSVHFVPEAEFRTDNWPEGTLIEKVRNPPRAELMAAHACPQPSSWACFAATGPRHSQPHL